MKVVQLHREALPLLHVYRRILDFLPVHIYASQREKSMCTYLQLMTLRNEPLSIVEDKLYWDFSKFYDKICHKALKEVLFFQGKLFKQRIYNEIKNKKGHIVYGGWTDFCVHYIVVLTSYFHEQAFFNIENLSQRLKLFFHYCTLHICRSAASVALSMFVCVPQSKLHSVPRRMPKTFAMSSIFSIYQLTCGLPVGLRKTVLWTNVSLNCFTCRILVARVIYSSWKFKLWSKRKCFGVLHFVCSEDNDRILVQPSNCALLRNLTILVPISERKTS